MNKRVIIVHGWEGSSLSDWFPWAKEELKKRGYEILVPNMPDADWPKIEPWVSALAQVAGEVDKKTIFVGHSIGCQAILRFLETLPPEQKADKVILVAPWFSLTPETTKEKEDVEIAEPWLKIPLNWEKVKEKANYFVAIFSDDDPYVPLTENKKLFAEKLGAEVIVKQNQGHFDESSGCRELPILLELI